MENHNIEKAIVVKVLETYSIEAYRVANPNIASKCMLMNAVAYTFMENIENIPRKFMRKISEKLKESYSMIEATLRKKGVRDVKGFLRLLSYTDAYMVDDLIIVGAPIEIDKNKLNPSFLEEAYSKGILKIHIYDDGVVITKGKMSIPAVFGIEYRHVKSHRGVQYSNSKSKDEVQIRVSSKIDHDDPSILILRTDEVYIVYGDKVTSFLMAPQAFLKLPDIKVILWDKASNI